MYDRMSTYLTWGGTIGTVASARETWQTGVHLALTGGTDGPGLPTDAELATILNGALSTFHSSGPVSLSMGAMLSWARCASLDDTGHYTTDPVLAERVPLSGGAADHNGASPQDSLVLTLYSGTQFGRANYGRMYMPWWSAWCNTTDGRVASGSVDAVAAAALDLVEGINAWAAAALSATARIRIMSKEGTGTTKTPAYLRVGDVKDTQQRRRRQIRERYTEAPISA